MTTRRIRVARGNVVVEVDDALQPMLERAVEAAMPAAVKVLYEEIDKILDAARAVWPVGRERTSASERGRPHSRDLFDIEVRLDPSGPAVEFVVINRADYAYKIKSGGISPWQAYIRKPILAAMKRIADETAAEIARSMQAA